MSLQGKVVYYILTGARKSAEAKHNVRILRELGAEVYVIMSQSAEEIADKHELEEASGHFVRTSFKKERPEHSLPLEDLVILAPATYNSINKIANGIADTLATSLVATAIGRGTPVYLAPAMHYELWVNPILQESISKLRKYGVQIIHPAIEGEKSTMADRLKVLDSVIHDFIRTRYNSKEVQDRNIRDLLTKYRATYYPVFREVGRRLEDMQLNGATAGCLSIRLDQGFLITSTGSKLGNLQEDELTLVLECDEQTNEVTWCGDHMPSSETPLHHIMYFSRPDVQAVLHSHCPQITYGDKYKPYRSKQFYSYGTFAFGRNLMEEMEEDEVKKNFIIAKDHGQIVLGEHLWQTVDVLDQLLTESHPTVTIA